MAPLYKPVATCMLLACLCSCEPSGTEVGETPSSPDFGNGSDSPLPEQPAESGDVPNDSDQEEEESYGGDASSNDGDDPSGPAVPPTDGEDLPPPEVSVPLPNETPEIPAESTDDPIPSMPGPSEPVEEPIQTPGQQGEQTDDSPPDPEEPIEQPTETPEPPSEQPDDSLAEPEEPAEPIEPTDPQPPLFPEEPVAVSVPGRIQAEHPTNLWDSTEGNLGVPICSNSDVDAEFTRDTDGGCSVGWTVDGEWLEYIIDVEQAGDYELSVRSAGYSGAFRLLVDEVDISGIQESRTGGWQMWGDFSFTTFLDVGEHTVRLEIITGGVNINYIDVSPDGSEQEQPTDPEEPSKQPSDSLEQPTEDPNTASDDNPQLSEAYNLYSQLVDPDLVQNLCAMCHIESGISGHTRLVFQQGPDSAAFNFNAIDNFVSTVSGGDEVILNKALGMDSHGGGAVLSTADAEYDDLREVLVLLSNTVDSLDKRDFFDGVGMELPERTLRRAALLFAGRFPTTEENTIASQGSEQFKNAIKMMMTGDEFHDFLIRNANDQLLTDAFREGMYLSVVNPDSPLYPNLAAKKYLSSDSSSFSQWVQKYRNGIIRSPLELIAHVVENDKPYTEILTADYTMVNPQMAEIFKSDTTFDTDDERVFKVGQNRGQILTDDLYVGEYISGLGLNIASHSVPIDYPHAGLLNDLAMLNRYPTTDTNRNRARSRWTYKFFLDVDIEKLTSRSTDVAALKDKNNPTLNNPACTTCHQIMDPVAGAFQNYGDFGWYRDSMGGRDSLPGTYKYAPDSDYQDGDTWFRDMRAPGFNGLLAEDSSNSLQWLARQIVEDERFAVATVKFWWPSVMSVDLIEQPEDVLHPNYQAKLNAYNAQEALVADLADKFRSGVSGTPYNLKDLLAEMVTTEWFRANRRVDTLATDRLVELETVGDSRLLTPEELEAKNAYLFNYVWGETIRDTFRGKHSALRDRYRVYYGGIDSVGITERMRELNTVMSNVAEAHALSAACQAVVMDFSKPRSNRTFFLDIEKLTTPNSLGAETLLRSQLQKLHFILLGERLEADSSEISASFNLLVELWNLRRTNGSPQQAIDWSKEYCKFENETWTRQVDMIEARKDPEYMLGAWIGMFQYFLTDYYYLHE